MNNKKGAIEMSITTIIVIVIGVTLLILGITFVKNIFGETIAISDKTFEQANTLIDEFENVDKFLTLSPSEITIEKAGDGVAKVIIANFEEKPKAITIKAKATPRKGDTNLECMFADTSESTSNQYIINSGEQERLALIVNEQDGPLRLTTCNVIIEGGKTTGSSAQVIIRVKKASSILN